METSTTFIILQFAFLAIFISSGESLKCVMCNSQTEPRCADPFQANSIPPSECTPESLKFANNVMKSASNVFKDIGSSLGFDSNYESPNLEHVECQKIDFTVNDKVQTIRSCSPAKSAQFDPCTTLGNKINSNTATLSHCSLCRDKDGCNGASGVAPKALLLIAAVVISSLAIFSRAAH